MDTLRQYRNRIEKVYGENDYWMVPIFRSFFVILLLAFLSRFFRMGGRLENPLFILSMGLLSFFLPFSFVPCLGALYLLYYFYTLSYLLLGLGTVFFVFVFLLQSSFRNRYAVLIALVPLCFYFHLPFFVPLLIGMSMGMTAFLSLDIGILVYYFLQFIRDNKKQFSTSADLMEQLDSLSKTFTPFLKNKEMFLMLMVLGLAALSIYIIRNFQFSYAFEISLLAGLAVEACTFILGPVLSLRLPLFSLFLSYLFSAVLALFLLFFLHDADYRGTEFVQFEDERYYYHVKAVPKKKG